MKDTKNSKVMALLFAAFQQELDSMNEAEGLTTFTELEQITQDCIIFSLNEREQEIWEY